MTAPVINSFTGNPNPCTIGSNVTFSWNISNATSAFITTPSGTVITIDPVVGTTYLGTSSFPGDGGYTWTLQASGPDGAVAQGVTITCVSPNLYPGPGPYGNSTFVAHRTVANSTSWNLAAWNTSTGALGWNPSGGPVTISHNGTGTPLSLTNWEGTGYNITASIVSAGANAVGSNVYLALSEIPYSLNGGEPGGTSPVYHIKGSQNGHDMVMNFAVSLQAPVDTFGVYINDMTDVEIGELVTIGFAQTGTGYNPLSYSLTVSGGGNPYISGPDSQGPVVIPGRTDGGNTSYDIKVTTPATYDTTIIVTVQLERDRAYGSDSTHWNPRFITASSIITTKKPPATNAPTYSGFVNLTGKPPLTSMYDPTSTYVTFTNFTGSRVLDLHCIGDNTNPGGDINSWTTAAVNGWYINESSTIAGPSTNIVNGTLARADIISAPFMDNPTINGLRTFRVTAHGDTGNNVQTFTVQTYLPDVNPNLSDISKSGVAEMTMIDYDPITIANLSSGATSYISIAYESGPAPSEPAMIQRTRSGVVTTAATMGIQNGDILVFKGKSGGASTSAVYRIKFGLTPAFADCSATVSITYTVSTGAAQQTLAGLTLGNINNAEVSTQYRSPTSGPMILSGFTGSYDIQVKPQGYLSSVYTSPPPNCYIIQNYSSTGLPYATMVDSDAGSRTIQIEAPSSTAYDTQLYYQVLVTPVGGAGANLASKMFYIKTRTPGTVPPQVVFDPTTGAPGELVYSNIVNFVTDEDGYLFQLRSAPSTSTEISVNGGAWEAFGPAPVIQLHQYANTLQLRTYASPAFGSVKTVIAYAMLDGQSSETDIGHWVVTTVGNSDLTIMAEY